MANPTDVSICNAALVRVGAQPITALTDTSVEGVLCNRHYDQTKRALLRAHPWKFARLRVALTAGTAPDFGYTYSYPLPSACLRVISMEGQEDFPWTIEGRNLLTDQNDCNIVYLDSAVLEAKFDATFCDALSAELAKLFSYSLVNNAALREELRKEAEQKLREARSFNGQEGAGDRVYSDSWFNSRA